MNTNNREFAQKAFGRDIQPGDIHKVNLNSPILGKVIELLQIAKEDGSPTFSIVPSIDLKHITCTTNEENPMVVRVFVDFATRSTVALTGGFNEEIYISTMKKLNGLDTELSYLLHDLNVMARCEQSEIVFKSKVVGNNLEDAYALLLTKVERDKVINLCPSEQTEEDVTVAVDLIRFNISHLIRLEALSLVDKIKRVPMVLREITLKHHKKGEFSMMLLNDKKVSNGNPISVSAGSLTIVPTRPIHTQRHFTPNGQVKVSKVHTFNCEYHLTGNIDQIILPADSEKLRYFMLDLEYISANIGIRRHVNAQGLYRELLKLI